MAAGPARVEVFLNDRALGTVTVGPELAPYLLTIPADLASSMARTEEAAQLRLVTNTWNPARAHACPAMSAISVSCSIASRSSDSIQATGSLAPPGHSCGRGWSPVVAPVGWRAACP